MSVTSSADATYAALMAALERRAREAERPKNSEWLDELIGAWAESDGPGPARIYVDAERECPT